MGLYVKFAIINLQFHQLKNNVIHQIPVPRFLIKYSMESNASVGMELLAIVLIVLVVVLIVFSAQIQSHVLNVHLDIILMLMLALFALLVA